MSNIAHEKIRVETNDIVAITGMYSYAGNPDPTKIPCWPSPKERSIFLEKGRKVPGISCNVTHSAIYELIGRA